MATQGMPPQHPQHPMSGHSGQQMQSHGDTRRMHGPTQSYITGQQMQAQQQFPGQQQHPNQYTHPQQQGHPMSVQQQYSQQQYQQQQQANQQMMGRSGMRQQVPQSGPMAQMGHQMQSGMSAQAMPASQQGYNAMYPPGGGLPGNKQRPTSLDLHSATSPRPSSQPNYNNQAQNQQQQHTGMLGSLFASGKKILEEATTPLGARGPFAHPNQSHTAMGHHPVGGPSSQGYSQYGTGVQQHQQMYSQSGQPMGQQLMGQPMGAGQQQGGTILSTVKNIFKL